MPPFSRMLIHARSYATRLPQRPRPKFPDPLLNVPHLPLTDNSTLTFIHRQPPTLPSPESLTTSPSSPLLRPPTLSPSSSAAQYSSWTDPNLPPISRAALINPTGPFPRMEDSAIEEMKRLRAENPAKWTRSNLAARFGCSKTFVSLVAGLKKPVWKKVIREQEKEHERIRSTWGERKSLVKKIQLRRKEFW